MGGGSQPIPNAHWAPVQFVLTVPAIRDRIVQAAVKLVIEPILEADFRDCSYGFRPKRGAREAIPSIAVFGALVLVPTMIGAVATELFIVGDSAIPPAVLLLGAVAVVWVRRHQIVRH